MRTVFKSDEIAHIWAHQRQEHGRTPANMSFDGAKFFSYYTCIAEIITHPKTGQRAYVHIFDNYSSSSSNHRSAALQAAHGNGPIFWHPYQPRGSREIVTTFKDTGTRIFNYALQRAAEAQAKAKTARTRAGFYNEEAARAMQEAEEANQFFGLRRKVSQDAIAKLQAEAEKAKRKYAKQIKERQKRAEEARREERESLLLLFEQWKRGFSIHTGRFYDFDTALRIDPTDAETVETSRGARVPTKDVKRAFYFIMKHRDGWRENGETFQIGGYNLNSINDAGLVIGCHRITWQEVYRFAAVLGLKVPEEQSEETK